MQTQVALVPGVAQRVRGGAQQGLERAQPGNNAEETGQVRVYLHGIRDQQGSRANERARPPVLKAVNWEINARTQAQDHRSTSLGRQEGLLATAAEREHWSKTFLLKQTKAGGGGPVATAKHPDLHKS